MDRFSNCLAQNMMSTLKPFFIYPSPWRGVSAQCLYTAPTFPPAGITTCPRNAQPQILLCRKSKSLQRQQHFFWTLWTQTSLSKDSHIRCPWQWAETWRGCCQHYPQISDGTRFASIYSISTGQNWATFREKKHDYSNSSATVSKWTSYFSSSSEEKSSQNPGIQPQNAFSVKTTPSSYPKTTQLNVATRPWYNILHMKRQ